MKKSSDDRPTKQQKRPTHEDIPDVRTRTAVQQAYDNERANPGVWKEWHARTDMKSCLPSARVPKVRPMKPLFTCHLALPTKCQLRST